MTAVNGAPTPTLLHQIYGVFAKQSKWQRRDPGFASDNAVQAQSSEVTCRLDVLPPLLCAIILI
jgi:hypothetical protein